MGVESGAVLILAMVILVLITLLGVYGARVSTTEMRIAANQRQAMAAFYAAESGIEEARARLPYLVQSASLTTTWRVFLGDRRLVANDQITALLSGYEPQYFLASRQQKIPYWVQIRFKTEAESGPDLCGDDPCINDIVYWGDDTGTGVFRENPVSCGNPPRGRPVVIMDSWGAGDAYPFSGGGRKSIHHIRVEVRWTPLPYALFAERLVDIGPGARVQAAAGSGSVANVATNGNAWARNGSVIDGRVDLGLDTNGRQASLHREGSPGSVIRRGTCPVKRIAPDPLQLEAGNLARAFSVAQVENDNLPAAAPAITDQTIILQHQPGFATAMTLAPGTYFITSLRLEANTTLTIGNASGPVTIYLNGGIRIAPDAHLVTAGPPDHLLIYCRPDATLDIATTDPFQAILYAPDARVILERAAIITGMIWADTISLKDGAALIYQPSIRSSLLAVVPQISWWQDDP